MDFQRRILIVGAGIIGLSTAYALLTQGMRHVTVLEQEAVDHEGCSSHGFSRLLRFEYGADSFYSRMVDLSLQRWKTLQSKVERTLYTPTGLLSMGTVADNCTYPGYVILRAMGLPTELISETQCRRRFPQFSTRGYDIFTYNSEAGILHASTCLRTLKDLILDLGGEVREFCHVSHLWSEGGYRPVRLELSSGDELVADRVVLATGGWVHTLLPHLRLPVRITRQYLLFFSVESPSLYSAGAFPAFIVDDLYGFPIHEGCNGWIKASSHSFGKTVHPDEISPPDEQMIAQITDKLCKLLPDLRHARLASVASCMYDVTPDENFILDRVPGDPRIIFATGMSGHAFKFGILLGELLASMVCDREPVVPLERFRLGRFARKEVEEEKFALARSFIS
ncbi:MAG TPA: FAD-dependent oxidoreductase [Ktedonobacteraceae bacterium]|jgi:monomeric sarcosine oxidase|nr:FAD-dependent oxidoreductase [Ktedonobacteraceae bacterium]